MRIEVTKLMDYFDPFDAWPEMDRPITREDIQKVLDNGNEELIDTPSWFQLLADKTPKEKHRMNHTKKIAYLVKHYDSEHTPISIEISQHGEPMIEDGNHRLAAAIFRNEKTISVEFGGFIDHADELGLAPTL